MFPTPSDRGMEINSSKLEEENNMYTFQICEIWEILSTYKPFSKMILVNFFHYDETVGTRKKKTTFKIG